jgi:hypothetical protein
MPSTLRGSDNFDTAIADTSNAIWDGIPMTEGEVNAIVTTAGTFVSAKRYPDGSIVGSTSLGSFTIYPNGEAVIYSLDISISAPTAHTGGMYYGDSGSQQSPLVLVSVHIITSKNMYAGGGMGNTMHEFYNTTTNYYSIRLIATVSGASCTATAKIEGRWK